MLLKHFFIEKIAHSSYLLAGNEICAIVDPRRDIEIYLESAKILGVTITHILETHLHADFISGHMELAERTGATIYAPRSGNCGFDHVALAEGDTITLENMVLEILETPGHTPEHISYVVKDLSRGNDAVGVFCGDTLFVGDVGRPDLFPGKAWELASKLYDSLHEKLLRLPAFCEVYPAHGAGSMCGRAMGAKWGSTIGYEKKYNGALHISDREEFIASLTSDMPGAPDHFGRCSDINRQGPAHLADLPPIHAFSPAEFHELSERDDVIVLDVREYDAYGGQHIPGSYNLPLGGNFPTFAGWTLPPDKNILLVAQDEWLVEEAAVWLWRVGLDNVAGYLEDGLYGWSAAGLDASHICQHSATEVHDLITMDDSILLVDVRGAREFAESHIKNAINIPAPELRTRYTELDRKQPMILTCSTGNRSSLAASILEQHGFVKLKNAAGGLKGYSAAAFAPACVMCSIPHGPQFILKRT